MPAASCAERGRTPTAGARDAALLAALPAEPSSRRTCEFPRSRQRGLQTARTACKTASLRRTSGRSASSATPWSTRFWRTPRRALPSCRAAGSFRDAGTIGRVQVPSAASVRNRRAACRRRRCRIRPRGLGDGLRGRPQRARHWPLSLAPGGNRAPLQVRAPQSRRAQCTGRRESRCREQGTSGAGRSGRVQGPLAREAGDRFRELRAKGDERLKMLERTDRLPDLQSDFATSKYRAMLLKKSQELWSAGKRAGPDVAERSWRRSSGRWSAWDERGGDWSDDVNEGMEALPGKGNMDGRHAGGRERTGQDSRCRGTVSAPAGISCAVRNAMRRSSPDASRSDP